MVIVTSANTAMPALRALFVTSGRRVTAPAMPAPNAYTAAEKREQQCK